MSFIIKGLPVPTGCYEKCGELPECPCLKEVFIPNKEKPNYVEMVTVCGVNGTVIEENRKGKPDNCPTCEVGGLTAEQMQNIAEEVRRENEEIKNSNEYNDENFQKNLDKIL